MYLYFFQLQAFGSGVALASLTRFLLQVSDAAGELGWQLERVGLLGDKVGLAMRGDSGSPFSSVDLG